MSKVLQLLALTALIAGAFALPLGIEDIENGKMGMSEDLKALKACETENPDCGYIAFNVYAKYNPEDEFVVQTLKENEKMVADLTKCESEDPKCDELKALAFATVFPDDAEDAEEEEGSSADPKTATGEHAELLGDLQECLEEDPLCKHLIVKAFCGEEKNAELESCTKIEELDAKFEKLAAACEKNPKKCAKVAKKALAVFFPEAFPKKELQLCKKDNKDCSFLVFKAYAHYHPESEWVAAVSEENNKMVAAVTECEAEDANCLELKAAAFAVLFPKSKKAQKEQKSNGESSAEHEKLSAEKNECFAKDPLCKHVVIDAFCDEPANAESRTCKKQIRTERKFGRMLKKCEKLTPNACKEISEKAVCDFFKDAPNC